MYHLFQIKHFCLPNRFLRFTTQKKPVCTIFFISSICLLTSLFVGLLNMFSIEEIFSCAQFSFGGVSPSMFTHNKFNLHSVSNLYNMVYNKLFLVRSGPFAHNRSLQWSIVFKKFYHQKKRKSIWNPLKVWNSKLTCSKLITIRLIRVSLGQLLAKCVQHFQVFSAHM